jgi:hypothetical protein
MGPLAIILVGGVAYYIYEKEKNPAWSPFKSLLATPVDKVVALEKVKVTSVPTPSPTVALDPHMTTDQVKQVNRTLSIETDPKRIAAHAIALGAAGHESSALALAAKAKAVGDAKALGASDVDIHSKQIEAAREAPEGSPVPFDAPMTACEAQVLLNALTSRQGHFDVEGVQVPLPITNVFDADTSHLIRIFQAEVHLSPSGVMDEETAKALRMQALGSTQLHAAGWGPLATGSSGPVATGFYGHLHYGYPYYGHPYYGSGGWSHPWEHGYAGRSHAWERDPWSYFTGMRERHEPEQREHRGRAQGHEQFGRGHEQRGRGHEQPFGHHEARQFGRGRQYNQFGDGNQFGMHPHHHRRHLTEEQLFEQQQAEQQQAEQMLPQHHHHHHHHHHPAVMQDQEMQQPLPAGMPIGGGGAAAAMAAPMPSDAETATQGSWFPDQPGSYGHDPLGTYGYDPGPGYEPGALGRDPYWGPNSGFGGYGSIGFGGPGGLGGYGSWGSFGGWGHGL